MPQTSATGKKTVAIKLQGGIGNQLFQYALGVYLGTGGQFDVCFLGDSFAQDPYGRKSIIERLDPQARIGTSGELVAANCRMLQEGHWPGLLNADVLLALMNDQQADTCILDGYWQNPAYANATALAQLRRGFAALPPAAVSPDTVAVHIRRNDYKHHGICRENYYIDSLRWVLAQVPQATFMVFSDEPNYTGHFLRQAGIPHQLVASGDDLLDMKRMSQCRMHVIANSTYSWWGAFLADTRIAIYPLPWSALHSPVANFFPPHWVGIQDAVSSAIEPLRYHEALAQIDLKSTRMAHEEY